MKYWLKCQWRSLFNPWPFEHQIWRLDGIGLVEIVQVSRHRDVHSWLKLRRIPTGEQMDWQAYEVFTCGEPAYLKFDDFNKKDSENG